MMIIMLIIKMSDLRKGIHQLDWMQFMVQYSSTLMENVTKKLKILISSASISYSSQWMHYSYYCYNMYASIIELLMLLLHPDPLLHLLQLYRHLIKTHQMLFLLYSSILQCLTPVLLLRVHLVLSEWVSSVIARCLLMYSLIQLYSMKCECL